MQITDAYDHTFRIVPMTCPRIRSILAQMAANIAREPHLADAHSHAAFITIRELTTALRDAWAADRVATLDNSTNSQST